MKRSNKFKLGVRDYLKGVLLAALSGVLFFIQDSLASEAFVFNWKKLAMAAVAGMVAYLIKNFFEGDKVPVSTLQQDEESASHSS
jgi:H+/Cl- antiporter ClcA